MKDVAGVAAAAATTTTGEVVSVVYVLKRNAKTLKNALEQHASILLIDKSYRMTAAVAVPTEASAELLLDDDLKACLAIPVLPAYFDTIDESNNEWKTMVVGTGKQHCPFSTSVLGNPQKRHTLQATTSTADGSSNQQQIINNNNGNWSPLKQALLETIQKHFQLDNDKDDQSSLIIASCWKGHIKKLENVMCPPKLEVLGDNKNIVLPPSALLAADLEAWIQMVLDVTVPSQTTTTTTTTNFSTGRFMQDLWKHVAEIYDCPGILRKGGVDPESQIRQTGYRLLWPKSTTTAATAVMTGPGSPGWITVTEQGIRQSFDVTNVMFSRGNITEKIRFGGSLVQPGDVVLDLYTGIGYYTLPALVRGKASFVYACEWNPKAIEALKYNLQDNRVADKAIVIEGDCRDLVLPVTTAGILPTPMAPINRVSLGLLPSSEGSWNIAVQSLMGTLPKEATTVDVDQPLSIEQPPIVGGWMHIHGNVPVKERELWSQWLCHSLYQHVQTEMNNNVKDTTIDRDWVVVCHHVEKVKSFAPTVNHYVADVFLGPRKRARSSFHPQLQPQGLGQLDDGDGTCYVYDRTTGKLTEAPANLAPPSCALSTDGVLHQAWMMSRTS